MTSALSNLWSSPEIRKKLLITALLLAIFRLIAHIPASGVDHQALRNLFLQSPFLSLLDVFSGGTLANFSILALGINPYINASIIIQLLTLVFPQLEELAKEGEAGRAKMNQYTRFLTIPLAAVQAIGMYFLLNSQGVVAGLSSVSLFVLVVTMTAGTMFAVWLGELITEYGIGNGISLLIFAGIVGRLPITASQTLTTSATEDIFPAVVFSLVSVIVIAGVVFMNEAIRKIPIQYARHAGRSGVVSNQTHLPLRLNQAGVIPIIFAISLVLAPTMLSQFLSKVPNPQLARFASDLGIWFQPQSAIYETTYFLLVVGFTFFYTAIVFNPTKISDEVKKHGGFIPGIRPGVETTHYLNFILLRVTLIGAVFLGAIAVLPSVIQSATNVTNLAIGGTGILIVVSVVLETVKKLEAQLVARNYDKFLR
ncbi:MAG: preprotein translocase subunit SecY [Candidatus Blackburnbacteria bacterium RIFCSPHIGHO2_01_FULL_44_64]|uniref:Protein translocase subunit SecY n=1 Tax=Candidatus Blackburnbacteria bacterium RIFCSPHIGHO2_02_FULL_44_20 TaxID=1797516 RepID=A0A1G1VAA6_9BACT|nr:MAG: preprotein translocase subunit SecY [Candidatus Blackburnbacteria bacterium RIFCSPHIGHO2_01_FULL_44_64]OGY11841.1 MAG: preprotein translocase subunit SecY [Candidatus Blackburnbacteria bacterium RIFCSPHIGHO2_12_FULL_44_25]OGY12375.1 MAG: preprotein translocase subunit SecY [Candidatus Blackburnbacteria bacterium RIFCSPHIGHO2_02_FULL_44_20]OGY15080.1 MAG: preprotein translocase subunit SecY [Candidatus Blackburnbacteria bacterium RIFCSPLOWO2_01_FULL_44_43]OGY16024.1 MAG: preprotein trans